MRTSSGRRERAGFPITILSRCLAGVARIVHQVGEPGFAAALVAATRCLVRSDSSLVMRYSRDRTPVVLHDGFHHDQRRNDLASYVAGAYLLDPFYLKAVGEGVEGAFRLRDIVAPGFKEGSYFRQYYEHSRVSDEVNYLVRLAKDTMLAISIERSAGNAPFSAEEMAALEALYPVLAELARADWATCPATGGADSAPYARHRDLRARLDSLGGDRLTARERDVLQVLLRGYDNREAGDLLGVASATVRVHRRSIYRKLEVTSIAALFAVALDTLLEPG